MRFRAALLILGSCVLLSAQSYTVNLPSEAFLVKLRMGLGTMTLPLAVQGPVLDGTVTVTNDTKTKLLTMQLVSPPHEAILKQIQEEGSLYVRYMVQLKDLRQYFDYDDSRVLHTAPEVKADLYQVATNGTVKPNSQTTRVAGLTPGRVLSYSHSRMLRKAKNSIWDGLNGIQESDISPEAFEKEMANFWSHPADDEWVMVDVMAGVLPSNDKVIVDGIKARVWGLVDATYLPYTKAGVVIRPIGHSFATEPHEGMPSLGVYLEHASAGFKSKGVVEKIFVDGMTSSVAQYLAPAPAPAPAPAN
jgi:hypothetical protein